MNQLAHKLSEKSIFRSLPSSDLDLLASSAIRRPLSPREHLCFQDDIWPYVVFVNSDRLRWVLLSAGGKEHQLFALLPDELFWAHSFFDDAPMPASLVAGKASVIYVWSRDTMLPILYRNPEAMFGITRMLTGIMRRARDIIYGLAFQPVAGRLANFIMSSLDDPEHPTLERDMTLEDMAAVCATSPEVVCRLLYQFQSDGVVQITRTRITINDHHALRHLADMD